MLHLRKGINHTDGRLSNLLNIDLQVIRPMRSESIHTGFAEDVGELVIFVGDLREIHWRLRSRSSTSRDSRQGSRRQAKTEINRTR